ncbi:conserved hypothetical protein [Ricinus communis]|uniref:Uncharacterized protein n=1 Tax=Ricinus communis TaxID=3988 RepID=B9SXT6_RICCO|nr:conserved hypothetical protein [Ricinus communis]
MDSSKHTEGCSSSESGWTMYIASPMQEDGNDCSDDTDDGNHHNDVIINDRHDHADDNEQQDSDDSMASDASSGPHHQYRYENPQRKGPLGNFKHSVGNKFNHCSPAEKTNKKDKKNDGNSNEKNRKLTANRKYSR